MSSTPAVHPVTTAIAKRRAPSARICCTRCIGAIGGRCIGTIGMVYPGTLFHGRQRGIPMHSYENRSQIRALACRGKFAIPDGPPRVAHRDARQRYAPSRGGCGRPRRRDKTEVDKDGRSALPVCVLVRGHTRASYWDCLWRSGGSRGNWHDTATGTSPRSSLCSFYHPTHGNQLPR